MQKAKFKILSLDGGGIRGIIPCKILAFIESQIGPISNSFDLLSGTSTGGIIALGLTNPNPKTAVPYSAEEMLNLYREFGDEIFAKRKRDLVSIISSVSSTTKTLGSKNYDVSNLENLLKTYFADAYLADSASEVLITCHDIEEGKPFYFSSRLAKQETLNDAKENFLVREVARSTSAAPTYFEPNILKDKEGSDLVFVDGGVFANNPSILAYAEAKEIWKARGNKGFNAVVTASDNDLPFYMLSIGTGFSRKSISGEEAKKWRGANWLEPLLTNVFMQSVAESTHYTMQYLLPPYTDNSLRYQRVNFNVPDDHIQMDDASEKNIKALCDLSDVYISQNERQLLQICEYLS